MPKKRRNQDKRIALLNRQRGRCHWCDCEMIFRFRKGGAAWPNEVTLEHLDDRYSADRGNYPGQFRVVAACWKCNSDRGKAHETAQPIEELQRRSMRGAAAVESMEGK